MALSMEEQRILDEMERNLAADDPRLASRLTSFGQQGSGKSQRVRTIAGLLALAMIAAVTITMFMLSPYVNGRRSDLPRAHPTAGATSAPAATTHGPATSQTTGKANTGAGANTGTAASNTPTARGASSALRASAAHASKAGTSKASTSKNSASRSTSH